MFRRQRAAARDETPQIHWQTSSRLMLEIKERERAGGRGVVLGPYAVRVPVRRHEEHFYVACGHFAGAVKGVRKVGRELFADAAASQRLLRLSPESSEERGTTACRVLAADDTEVGVVRRMTGRGLRATQWEMTQPGLGVVHGSPWWSAGGPRAGLARGVGKAFETALDAVMSLGEGNDSVAQHRSVLWMLEGKKVMESTGPSVRLLDADLDRRLAMAYLIMDAEASGLH